MCAAKNFSGWVLCGPNLCSVAITAAKGPTARDIFHVSHDGVGAGNRIATKHLFTIVNQGLLTTVEPANETRTGYVKQSAHGSTVCSTSIVEDAGAYSLYSPDEEAGKEDEHQNKMIR